MYKMRTVLGLVLCLSALPASAKVTLNQSDCDALRAFLFAAADNSDATGRYITLATDAITDLGAQAAVHAVRSNETARMAKSTAKIKMVTAQAELLTQTSNDMARKVNALVPIMQACNS